MVDLPYFPPGLILILGALLIPFLKGYVRSAWTVILPVLALIYIHYLPLGTPSAVWQMIPGMDVEWLRVDKLSKAFGYIFTINAVAVFIYAFYYRKSSQHVAALIYIGGALGTVFSGDLVSAYVNWEIMAIASTFVILANRETPLKAKKARGAAYRYVLLHVLGGLFFLAGLVITIAKGDGIAFDGFSRENAHLGTWLILAGFLVNAAAPPLHAWLSDAYPEASISGGLILTAYTTKTAVYTLLRGFHGGSWEILIWIGCAMAIYGTIYALLENDMRRVLAYSIINQVGFMICAAGIGTPEAISGATAHAFSHILYKSLLWMAAGAVIYRLGISKCTELGGLYKTMPWTTTWAVIGALASLAFPLTSGFTTKTIITDSMKYGIESGHPDWYWPWLIMKIASAGVFLHTGIKFPYFVFFHQDKNRLRPKEAPASMHIAMVSVVTLIIMIGCLWKPLYDVLPYPVVFEGKPFKPYTIPHLITQLQLLLFGALAFFLLLRFVKMKDATLIDTDIFWRKGGKVFYRFVDKGLNGINTFTRGFVIDTVCANVSRFFQAAPAKILSAALYPMWKMQGQGSEQVVRSQEKMRSRAEYGTFVIGITALIAVLLIALLTVISKVF